MNVESIKYCTCDEDEDEGILLVDIETETEPTTDEDGCLLYYCPAGQHIFSSDEDEGGDRE